jgi:hypothetical protein
MDSHPGIEPGSSWLSTKRSPVELIAMILYPREVPRVRRTGVEPALNRPSFYRHYQLGYRRKRTA